MPLPPSIPHRETTPPFRTYEQIVEDLNETQIEEMRRTAKDYWSHATEGYKSAFQSDEEGIQGLVCLADWARMISQKQERR